MKEIKTKRSVGDKDFKFEWFWQWFINQDIPYISIKDRLPSDGQNVELLVVFKDIDQLPINIERVWNINIFEEEDKEVSHWRSLGDHCYLCAKVLPNPEDQNKHWGDGKGKFWCLSCHERHVREMTEKDPNYWRKL